jgi:hypothetical protein
VLAPNKTLAAQLYGEFRKLFPRNAVEYFVSYYDYYQPEAYVPSSDTYIEKDSLINEAIDRLRHAATRSLLERNDVIIVASVSCIYGLGSAEAYEGMLLALEQGQQVHRHDILAKLVEIQYERNEQDFHRGTFRVAGRRGRRVPGVRRRRRDPDRAVRRRGRRAVDHRPAARQEARAARQASRSTRRRTTSRPRRSSSAPSPPSAPSSGSASSSCAAPTSCSRPSGSSSARCSTSR